MALILPNNIVSGCTRTWYWYVFVCLCSGAQGGEGISRTKQKTSDKKKALHAWQKAHSTRETRHTSQTRDKRDTMVHLAIFFFRKHKIMQRGMSWDPQPQLVISVYS